MADATSRRAPSRRSRVGGRDAVPPQLLIPAVCALGLLVLPLVGLLIRAPWSRTWEILASPGLQQALGLSISTALVASLCCVVLGVPLGWLLAQPWLPGARLLRALATVPLVLPPVVGGVALFALLGRRGALGEPVFEFTGLALPFTTPAVVVAQVFVALPFQVLAAEGAFRASDERYAQVAATLGASPWTAFRRVTLPMVAPSVLAGAVLSWGRALGEFGATVTFAGNLPGRTQTLPLQVYLLLQTDPDAAIMAAVTMLFISVALLVALRGRWTVTP